MTINIKELKIPRRPKVYNGIKIQGVNFGMAWHSVHWASDIDLANYVEAYWKKDAMAKDFEEHTQDIFPYIDRRRKLNVLQEDTEYKKWQQICADSRKNIRAAKWKAISDELLVIINDNPWGWPLEKSDIDYSIAWKARPRKGDLMMCIDDKDKYRGNNSRVYNVIQDRVDYTLRVILPDSHSIVDTVLPLSFYT